MGESQEKLVQIACPGCGSLVKAPASRVGRHLPCPKCGQRIEIRTDASPSPLRESQVYVAPPSSDDEYAVQEVPHDIREPAPGEHSGPVIPVWDHSHEFTDDELPPDQRPSSREPWRDKLPLSERPKPPRHPMINGVLTFFFSLGGVVCWAGFTATAVLVLILADMAVGAMNTSQFGPVATFLMGMIALLIALIGLLSASGFLMAILQDSAAGNKVIVEWPEPIFVDWIGAAIYFLVSAVVPLGALHLLALPFGGILSVWWLAPVVLWLLFPVVLLSTLEKQSPLAVVSPIVLESLVKRGWTWAVFFLESGLMIVGLALLAAGVLSLVFMGFKNVALLKMVGLGALAGVMVAAAMLYFRLLGRLTWICDEYFRLETVDEEDEDDEDPAEEDDDSPPIRPTPIHDF
ncbi:MAG: hypothetical protein JW719_12085 [Pirellulales bacterium]|nr:hypothetical protein [Pirellulales bacterium]